MKASFDKQELMAGLAELEKRAREQRPSGRPAAAPSDRLGPRPGGDRSRGEVQTRAQARGGRAYGDCVRRGGRPRGRPLSQSMMIEAALDAAAPAAVDPRETLAPSRSAATSSTSSPTRNSGLQLQSKGARPAPRRSRMRRGSSSSCASRPRPLPSPNSPIGPGQRPSRICAQYRERAFASSPLDLCGDGDPDHHRFARRRRGLVRRREGHGCAPEPSKPAQQDRSAAGVDGGPRA